MEMTDVFEKLKSLQDILSEKYSIENQIEESPKKLTTQDELLARLKKEYIEKNAQYEEVRSVVAKLRTELADAEAAREKGEKAMDSITTHREYEALQKEIDDASQLEQSIRKELQKEEKNLAGLDDSLKQEEQLINSQEAELAAGKERLDAEIEGYRQKLAELKTQEESLVPGIDTDIIFKFERIIKSKQGKGIVAVKGNVCDGCHMILPAQFANEVRNGENIVFCPYCSRILFYQEVQEGEAEFFQMGETGSLADFEDDEDLLDTGFDDEEDDEFDDSEDSDSPKDLDFDD
ncbi:MAG: zinc ribbon domain-containing protein [Treponemataceae bacterium]|nr:zinc ribbon domain-containing protein [Treponemataceae bacterium]